MAAPTEEDLCVPAGQPSQTGPAKWRSTRFLLCYLASLGMCMMYFERVSLSLAIVCMVNHTALRDTPLSSTPLLSVEVNVSGGVTRHGVSAGNVLTTEGLAVHVTNSSGPPTSRQRDDDDDVTCQASRDGDVDSEAESEEDGPFAWDKQTQGLLLSAIYVSYTAMQIPSIYVIGRFGVRRTAGVGMLCMSVCHVLCHPAALLSPWAVLTLRVLMGVCTAVIYPAIYGMWGRWAPKAEQGQLIGVAFSGQMVANATVFPLSAVLCRHGFLGGWASVFYAFGGLGILWSVVWLLLMTDSPETHPRISVTERHYIVTTRADVTQQKDKMPVPWRMILRSPRFWALAVAHFVYDWGFFLLMTNLPTFLYETMHFDIQSNGLYSMLPYIALFLVTSSAGFLSDVIIKRSWLSVGAVRKLFTTVALCTAAVLLVVMSHLPCHQVGAVVGLLTVAVGVSGLALTGGFFLNPYDLSPRHAVAICTVTNSIACTAGFLNPYLVAALTVNQKREEWQLVFYVTGALYVAGSGVFCVLGSGHLQPWAVPPHTHTHVEEREEEEEEEEKEKLDRTGDSWPL
ncbi:putative transporter slc-17.2 [Babylonia areolata]|uniref:putative transporter slc-17.2 n=1 Tax=Babylonia areolata TaxID=304850 RepID=UPI003FD1A8CB